MQLVPCGATSRVHPKCANRTGRRDYIGDITLKEGSRGSISGRSKTLAIERLSLHPGPLFESPRAARRISANFSSNLLQGDPADGQRARFVADLGEAGLS